MTPETNYGLKRSVARVVLALLVVVVVVYLSTTTFGHAVGRRITAENLAPLMAAIAWPLAVLTSVFLLRPAILRLLRRVAKLVLGPNAVEFNPDEEGFDATRTAPRATFSADEESLRDSLPPAIPPGPTGPTGPPTQNPSAETAGPRIKKEKVSSIYWTGCDLTFVYDVILRGGDRGNITHVLRQANHHMKGSGMKDSGLQVRLQRILDDATKSLEKDWTPDRRVEVAREVYQIAREFGDMTMDLQPGFSGDPKTSD